MYVIRFLILALMVLALAGRVWAGGKAAEDKTGLKLGAKAPAFKLNDQNGKQRTLDELLQKGKVAIVFHRSANW